MQKRKKKNQSMKNWTWILLGDILDINELVKRSIRIIHISRKPTGEEYSKVAKITAIGMTILGLVGFVIFILFGLIG